MRVRQAANYAMNRDEMVEMLGGIAQPGYAIYTPTSKLYGNPVKYEFDTKKATALLKEAGCYPCNVTLAISTSGSGQMQPLPMNELVKAQLEAVGLQGQARGDGLERLARRRHQGPREVSRSTTPSTSAAPRRIRSTACCAS